MKKEEQRITDKFKTVCSFILICLILVNVIVFCRIIYLKQEEWKLILVNAANPIPEDYNVQTAEITDGVLIDKRIEKKLSKMMEAAEKEGISLKVEIGRAHV